MAQLSLTLLSLLFLLVCVSCEDWFMLNSHMISDREFKTAIKEAGTYKVVKFFTPHCVYCRYLKNVFDKLKSENNYQFPIYQLNCAWYPQLCNNELKIGSFPYTVVYDQKGDIDTHITGFYPQPVIKDLLDQITNTMKQLRKTSHLSTQEERVEKPIEVGTNQQNVHSQPNELISQHQVTSNKQESPQIIKEEVAVKQNNSHHTEKAEDSEKFEAKKENKQKQGEMHHADLNETHLPGIYQHIFFAICILLGVMYFSSFMHFIQSPKGNLNPEFQRNWSKLQNQ